MFIQNLIKLQSTILRLVLKKKHRKITFWNTSNKKSRI